MRDLTRQRGVLCRDSIPIYPFQILSNMAYATRRGAEMEIIRGSTFHGSADWPKNPKAREGIARLPDPSRSQQSVSYAHCLGLRFQGKAR